MFAWAHIEGVSQIIDVGMLVIVIVPLGDVKQPVMLGGNPVPHGTILLLEESIFQNIYNLIWESRLGILLKANAHLHGVLPF